MNKNRVLTDIDRTALAPVIQSMWELCPDMMSRKITEANVQQAFVFNYVRTLMRYKKDATVLSVGCFEDTAYESLKNEGHEVIGIDPEHDYDLHTFASNVSSKFDIVFATSVIEHVRDDEEFLADMCKLLNPGGYGILTTDFKDDYKFGDPLPYSDKRFYTKYDLEFRLRNILKDNDCDLVDEPDWSGKDNFVYQGHHYSFATFVFRKNPDV
jgi:SAM-dependent methyltransferase